MKTIEDRSKDLLEEYAELCKKHKVMFCCNEDGTNTSFKSITDDGEIKFYTDIVKFDEFIERIRLSYL